MQVVEKLKAKLLKKLDQEHIKKGSKIIADGFRAYKFQNIQKDNSVEFDMVSVDSKDSKLKWLHTIISNVKAFILGAFHGLKANESQFYLDEFCYRLKSKIYSSSCL